MVTAGAHAVPPETKLVLYRFYSKADLNEANIAVYHLENGLFYPKQIGRVQFDFRQYLVGKSPTCSSLLEHLQNFSLHVYQSSNYLTSEQQKAQADKVAKLRPETVTFLELSTPVKQSLVDNDPVKYPLLKMAPWLDVTKPGTYQERKAVMWVLAGQFVYPFSQTQYDQLKSEHPNRWREMNSLSNEQKQNAMNFNFVQMPWETSVHDTFSIDRKKYRLTWELGRAAQVEPEHIPVLMRAALAAIHEDIETMQGDVEDAYVFVKAMDSLRARHFKAAGFKPFEGHCSSEGECVLVASVTALLEKYPITEMSGRLKLLETKLRLSRNWDFITNALRRIQLYFHAELDFVATQFKIFQEQPVIMHDFSNNYLFLVKGLGETAGLSTDEAVALAKHVESWRDDFSVLGKSANDAVLAQPFLSDFRRKNVVRLTNIDEKVVSNPNAIPLLLIGIDDYLLSRYRELSPIDGNLVLDYLNTLIVIQTTSENVARVVRHFEPNEFSSLDLPIHMRAARGYGTKLFTFAFTRDQVRRIRVMNSEWSKERALSQGPRFFKNISANPAKF